MALADCKGFLYTVRPHFVYCQVKDYAVGAWPGGGFV